MAVTLDIAYLEDVAGDPRADVRAALADQMARHVIDPLTGADDREVLIPFMLGLADDAVMAVRAALAKPLRTSTRAPRRLLFALIGDVEAISLPILQCSPVFTERDLVAIARRADPPRLAAIAARKELTPAVSTVLIARGPEGVCVRLLRNVAAPVAPGEYEELARRYPGSAAVRDGLLGRSDLPVALRVRLVCGLSADMGGAIRSGAWLGAGRGEEVVAAARDAALLTLAKETCEREQPDLVRALHDQGQLTAGLIVGAACAGNMHFVECALAFLARMPVARARDLMHAGAGLGLSALSRRTGLPETAAALVRLAAAVSLERAPDTRAGPHEEELFSRRMIERLMSEALPHGPAGQIGMLQLLVRFAPADARALAHHLLGCLGDKAA